MNLRKERGRLNTPQCRALEHAWVQAAKDGYPLNAKIAIRPAASLSPVEHVELVNKTWNRLGVWSRRHTSDETFHAILVRETEPCDHFHLLMHVENNACLILLRHALAQWSPNDDIHVTRAYQTVSYTPSGKIRSALGYITKERTPQAAWPKWQYRPGRPVLGKRYRITANLRAVPIVVGVPLASEQAITGNNSRLSNRRRAVGGL